MIKSNYSPETSAQNHRQKTKQIEDRRKKTKTQFDDLWHRIKRKDKKGIISQARWLMVLMFFFSLIDTISYHTHTHTLTQFIINYMTTSNP